MEEAAHKFLENLREDNVSTMLIIWTNKTGETGTTISTEDATIAHIMALIGLMERMKFDLIEHMNHPPKNDNLN